MPLNDIFEFVRAHRNNTISREKFRHRVLEVIQETWYLGFTAFGGPPVHFQIFHKKFVRPSGGRESWLDEQTYQELFAICQALPGPGSTKFLFATVLLRSGWICAFIAFLLWSVPGALCMFGLALGVRQISSTLPSPVYALLSGLNASTVGIVAVAAVQLSEKCIKDSLSRVLIILGACAGLCYSALWYFPLLMTIGGLSSAIWDLWLGRMARIVKQKWADRRRRAADQAAVAEDGITLSAPPTTSNQQAAISMPPVLGQPDVLHANPQITKRKQAVPRADPAQSPEPASTCLPAPRTVSPVVEASRSSYEISVRTGAILFAAFVISFVTVLVVRSQLSREYRPLSLFASMYLAGTIIFGGGPVVIPLLTEYVVVPGWVEPRDFLIGLAIIQALPGPNFNFSVYLGALAMGSVHLRNSSGAASSGALLAFVGIFVPGLVITAAFQGFWRKLRTRPLFLALLRGINASAIGLVYTAIYRLWEVGYLTNESTTGNSPSEKLAGRSLADEPWWVVVAVLTFAGNRWFDVAAPVGIMMGGVLGLSWWAATQR